MQQVDASGPKGDSAFQLWWLPVGAGGHVVIHTSRWWELWRAWRERRPPEPIFHAALEMYLEDQRFLIEMTPAWGQPTGERGVVGTGPVGAAPLGKLKLFRYEVRCWPDGLLPDRQYAVGPPVRVPIEPAQAAKLLTLAHEIPPFTWGRRVQGSAEMWNSNSVISWLLTRAELDATQFEPPTGYAPGWSTGIALGNTSAEP